MRVQEAMRVHAVRILPDASLREALDMIDLYQAPLLPVVDPEDRLVGTVSEPDVTAALLEAISSGAEGAAAGIEQAWRRLYVRDIMAVPPIHVEESATLTEAARLLANAGLARLPVTSEGRLTGLLGRADICQAVLERTSSD